MADKTVLITGSSTGFGRLAAQTFQSKGWNVAATMRSPEKGSDLAALENLSVLALDVTDPASIEAAVSATLSEFGQIDVAVNNAGYGSNALFEQSSDASIRQMYDTNVFGVMNVMREVLPHMRERNSGRVINVTSMAGLMGIPANSVYASSKYAVEGLTESIALEYKPLGIKAMTVAPGAYHSTAFMQNVVRLIESGDADLVAYAQKLNEHFGKAAGRDAKPQDPQEVADIIYRCATEDMPVHNPVGADAQMLMGVMSQSPTRQDFIGAMEGMLLPAE